MALSLHRRIHQDHFRSFTLILTGITIGVSVMAVLCLPRRQRLYINSESDNVAKVQAVRIFCLVMTTAGNIQNKALPVFKTWGKRCNKILFFSEIDDASVPMLKVNTGVGREYLTDKVVTVLDYVYAKHINDADWFLKCDDDTYVIVENLRYFLSGQDPSHPIHFGHFLTEKNKTLFFNGGSGYVLSREALRRFGSRPSKVCDGTGYGSREDVYMSLCMETLGAVAGDALDRLGRSRFHVCNPQSHITGKYPYWYMEQDWINGNVSRKGIESISQYAITFHYVTKEDLFNLEFYLYHVRPYGLRELLHLNK